MSRQASSVAPKAPALQYLDLVGRRIIAIRRDVPHLIEMGEQMAGRLLAGGEMFTPAVAKFWPSEFGGRAGGLMGLRPSGYVPKSANDVAYFALPDPHRWDPRQDKELERLIRGKGQLFVIGRPQDLKKLNLNGRIAGFTGGVDPNAGLYGTESHRPLASLREFEHFVRGWIVAGEMIAACTRGGKMPIIWMSVWLEGALVRNASFTQHNNLREPWRVPLFHDARHIPPLSPGYVAAAFLDELAKIHVTLMGQAAQLADAGQWLAQAKRADKRIWTVAVGHSYPQILDLPQKNDYPVEWGHSISDLARAMPPELGRGDVALHLGYAPVVVENVKGLLARGMRLIHTSPYGRPADLKDHRDFLWLDLPWRPTDQTVDVPGYSVRILPMSSSAQTMALFAILSEMAERMGWR